MKRIAKTLQPVPRMRLGDAEKKAIADHVRSKFQGLAGKIKYLDLMGSGETFKFGDYFFRVEKVQKKELQHRLDAVRRSLERLGFYKDDAVAIVDDLIGGEDAFLTMNIERQERRRKSERGVRLLLRQWAPWFRNEMSAEKIAEITGRRKSAEIPLRVAASITRDLLHDNYRVSLDVGRIEDLMSQTWKNPPQIRPPIPLRYSVAIE